MKNPEFYCQKFIDCQSYSPKYQPKDCKQQCDKCINEIIDYHAKKNTRRGFISPGTSTNG